MLFRSIVVFGFTGWVFVMLVLLSLTHRQLSAATILRSPVGSITTSANTMSFDSENHNFNFINGNIGVGVGLPQATLDVGGEISANAVQVNGPIQAMHASFSGTLTANAFAGDGSGLSNVSVSEVLSLVNSDISANAAIETSKVSGAVSSISNHGLASVSFSGDFNHLTGTSNSKIFLFADNTGSLAYSSNQVIDFDSADASGGTGYKSFTGTVLTVDKDCYLYIGVNLSVLNNGADDRDPCQLIIQKSTDGGSSYQDIVEMRVDPGGFSTASREYSWYFSGIVQVDSSGSDDRIQISIEGVDHTQSFSSRGLLVKEI